MKFCTERAMDGFCGDDGFSFELKVHRKSEIVE